MKPAIVLLRHNENNYSLSIAVVDIPAAASRSYLDREGAAVGAAAAAIFWLLETAEEQDQKIAACGNAYRGTALPIGRCTTCGLAGKLAGRLCLAEGLWHDDPTAG